MEFWGDFGGPFLLGELDDVDLVELADAGLDGFGVGRVGGAWSEEDSGDVECDGITDYRANVGGVLDLIEYPECGVAAEWRGGDVFFKDGHDAGWCFEAACMRHDVGTDFLCRNVGFKWKRDTVNELGDEVGMRGEDVSNIFGIFEDVFVVLGAIVFIDLEFFDVANEAIFFACNDHE